MVTSVTDKGPAARAGLKPGDVIVAVGGQPVDDPNAFDYRFTTHPLGGKVELGVVRGGKESKVAVALETAPESPRDEIVIEARSPFTGAKVANLSPALADELRLDASTEGVVVVEIADGTLAQQFGFQRGDIVLGGQRRQDRQDRATRKAAPGRRPRLARHHPARRPADFGRVRRMSLPAAANAAQGRACSPRRGSTTTRRGRSPTSCVRKSSPTSSARIICSARTAR